MRFGFILKNKNTEDLRNSQKLKKSGSQKKLEGVDDKEGGAVPVAQTPAPTPVSEGAGGVSQVA